MADYIDRQMAIDEINKALDRETLLNRFVRKVAVEAVKKLPSAGVQPVVSMHWTPIFPFKGGWSDVWRCSACGSQVSLGYCTDVMDYDFCPYCGARKGEQND